MSRCLESFLRASLVSFLGASVLLHPAPRLEAQQPDEVLSFRHLTIADGLSQNSVSAIVQDRRGFLWVGTKDGLNRYDGHAFLTFHHDPFDRGSLSDGEVTSLLVDGGGTLWVGTRRGGLNRFDRRREAFHRHAGGPRRAITSIREDASGYLWIGSDGEGLFRFDPRPETHSQHVWRRFAHDPGDPRSLDSDRVHAVLIDRAGTVWAGTEVGLNRLDGRGSAAGFIRYAADPAAPDGLIDAPVTALLEDSGGRLWIGSLPGLSVLDADRRRTMHHYHRYRVHRYGWGRAIQLLEALDGRIWLSTHAELMRFDPVSGTFAYFRHDPDDPRSINSDLPTALFQDRSGVLWVGTNGFGLNAHDPKASRFRSVRAPRTGESRLSGFSVHTIFEDSGGDLWVDAGVLYRRDRRTGAFRSYETTSDQPHDFGNAGVWSIAEHPEGVLWAGTYAGLFRHEAATGRTRRFGHDPTRPEGLPEQVVFDVHRDREGAIWVVTERYLARLDDPGSGRFTAYRYEAGPTSGQWTFPSLHEDSAGNFWFGSNRGLLRFDRRSATFRRYRNDPGNPATLAHDGVRSILPDPRRPHEFLWIGTAGGGLDRFDMERETFVHHTRRQGLPNDVVYGVLADDAGALWLSSNRGLSRFDLETGTFRNFDSEDGLQSDEFNSGAYFRGPSGELYFGGIYGFTHFHPERVEDNLHVPEVVITGFRRGNERETVRDSGTVLSVAISEADTLRLSHKDGFIAFEFAALDFSAPRKNRYAYRMVGLNDRWIESGGVRSATYANLPPGRYTFQVRASNNDGIWNERGASLAVLVAPPWWRTWWAYAAYGLILLGAAYGLRRHELGRLRLERRLEIQRLKSEKLRDVDRAKSRFYADISHEFRTPLTLTLGPLDDLRAGLHGPLSPAMRDQVELARRSAGRVLELIDQILELARLEARRTPLHARRVDLRESVRRVAQSFAPLAERESLTLDVRVPAGPVALHADPEQLEKVFSNLLSNALKFTLAGGTVRVSVETDETSARVAVRDSGPGIPAGELERVFDRFHRADGPATRWQPGTGIGLALARELVELHGGSLRVESEEGFGSTFTATLPLGTAHLRADQLVGVEEEIGAREAAEVPAVPVAEDLRAGEAARDHMADYACPSAVSSANDASGPSASGGRENAALWKGAAPEGDAGDGDAEPENDVTTDDDVTTALLVEDNADVRAYLKRHLADIYRVLEAPDGETGLQMARTGLPDIVISDVMMPGMDGHALCQALKEDPETDFIPVVLLTARAGIENRVAGLRTRADDYVTKPFDVPELLARVQNLIASRKRLRERFSTTAPGRSLALHPSLVEVEPADERFLEQVREAIEVHLGDESFSVERLAREVSHSRGHLHRRLRALLDETPSALIRRMRLERAAQLIEGEAGSIGSIAYAVGFKSVAHFSNRFQDHFGVRPSKYVASSRDVRDEDSCTHSVGV